MTPEERAGQILSSGAFADYAPEIRLDYQEAAAAEIARHIREAIESDSSMPTVELTQMPSRSDFEAVKSRAHDDCECTEEMKLMFKETGVSCKPCAARHTLNGIAMLSEKL